MLVHDAPAPRLDGATVYQAFPSSFSYHRWHGPLAGRSVTTIVVDGAGYARHRADGFNGCDARWRSSKRTVRASA